MTAAWSAKRVGKKRYREVIDGQFRIRNLASGQSEKFRLAWCTQEKMAGKPVLIVDRPRWWFEAELILEEEGESPDG